MPKQETARCLFCGAAGVTKEHILSRSFIDLFPGHGTVRHEYSHPELGVAPRIKRANSFAYISRKFCRGCNGGWMRDCDESVRPLLSAFANDWPLSLMPSAQELLALWMTKVSLGYLSIEPDEYRFAVPERYADLYGRRTPLPGSQIWLGANDHGDLGWARAHSLRFDYGTAESDPFGVSLSFGHAVLHLIYHGSDDHTLRLRMEPHRALKPIWPVQTPAVQWPPRIRFQHPDLTWLPRLINQNCDFLHVAAAA